MLLIEPPPPDPPTVGMYLRAAGRLVLGRIRRIDWAKVVMLVSKVVMFVVAVLTLLVMLHTSDTTLGEVLRDAPDRVVWWSARDGPQQDVRRGGWPRGPAPPIAPS